MAGVAGGNLFWRRGDQLFTPAVEVGCRAGVMRGWVHRMTATTEGSFPLEGLARADEIFWTNSLRGIVSINEFSGRSLADFSQAAALRRHYARELL